MDYESQMTLVAKKKKKKQFFGLVFVILLLGVGAYFIYGWQQNRGEKNFLKTAQEVLKSVEDNYKNDNMLTGESLEDVVYTFPDSSVVNFNDRMLKGGTIIQYMNGTVAFAIYDDSWCAIKKRSRTSIQVTAYDGNCAIEK